MESKECVIQISETRYSMLCSTNKGGLSVKRKVGHSDSSLCSRTYKYWEFDIAHKIFDSAPTLKKYFSCVPFKLYYEANYNTCI